MESEGDVKNYNRDDEVLPAIDRHLAETIQHELTSRANIQKMHLHD